MKERQTFMSRGDRQKDLDSLSRDKEKEMEDRSRYRRSERMTDDVLKKKSEEME